MNFATLAGKTALITGASRGIGFGITQALARNGVSCILVGRNTETLNARIRELPLNGHKSVTGDIAAYATWATFESENVRVFVASVDVGNFDRYFSQRRWDNA